MGTKDASPYALAGTETVEGIEHPKISRTSASTNTREEIVLSTDDSCLPIRYAHYFGDVKFVEADIEYEVRHAMQPVPARWKVSLLTNGGDALQSSSGIVKELKVNEIMADSLFSIVFPPNTLVTEIGKKLQKFIVDENGKWVPRTDYRAPLR